MAKKQRRIPGKIIVVAACHNASGEPDLAIVAVSATENEIKNGDHYEKAEEKLLDDDYDEPIVMFDEDKCPEWLFEGACQQCGVKSVQDLDEEEDDFDESEDYDDDDSDEDDEDDLDGVGEDDDEEE